MHVDKWYIYDLVTTEVIVYCNLASRPPRFYSKWGY